jgi:preprotein translocase subunit SecG
MIPASPAPGGTAFLPPFAPFAPFGFKEMEAAGGRLGGWDPRPGVWFRPPGLGPPRLDFRPASREQPVRGCSQSHGPGPPPAGPDAELPRPMDLTNGILTPALLDPGVLTLGVSQIVIGLLTVGFLACSILLVLTVLIQRPQGGGLSGAFGAGAGSGETAFGARTGDALTIATISFFVLWLVVAVGLVLVMSPPKVTNTNPAATSNQAPVQPGDTGPAPEQAIPEQGVPEQGVPEQPAPEQPGTEAPAGTPATETPPTEIPPTELPAGEAGGGTEGETAPPTNDGQGG